MCDIAAELTELRLPSTVSTWSDLQEQDESAVLSSTRLIDHLLQAEQTDRAIRSLNHQIFAAKFPLHRDLAGFDFTSSKVDQILVRQLATLALTGTVQNCRPHRRSGHRQDTPGYRDGSVGDSDERHAGMLLLGGRPSRFAGT